MSPLPSPSKRQRGTVIIITLWTITLLTILVTALAAQIRLSAQVARFHNDNLQGWAGLLAAVNQAEMELLMETMPLEIQTLEEVMAMRRNPRYRFDGSPQTLSYPQAEDIVVRIYEHAGKINLRDLSRGRLRGLLEKKLGPEADPRQFEELMAAWGDWHDVNDLPSLNGAERDYYLGLDPPYEPRNGPLESVEELLLIRGFAEVFADVDLDAAFTLYGEGDLINPNVATVEALRLLPGLDDTLIAELLAWRADNEFVGPGDVARLIPAESMAQLRIWLNPRKTTNFFTIIAHRQPPATSTAGAGAEAEADAALFSSDPTLSGFAETIGVASFNERPRVLKINPFQRLPAIRTGADTQDP